MACPCWRALPTASWAIRSNWTSSSSEPPLRRPSEAKSVATPPRVVVSARSVSDWTRPRRFIGLRRRSTIDSRASRKAWPDLATQAAQPVAGVSLGGIELGGDGLELHANRRQALEQGVVNLAAQAGALCEDERVLVAHRSQPQPPRRDQEGESVPLRSPRTGRPVIGRRHLDGETPAPRPTARRYAAATRKR